MGVDTRDKRMSMLGITNPVVRVLKNPSGSVNATSRAILLFLYSGVLPNPPAPFSPLWARSANVTIVGPTMPVGSVQD